VTASLGDRDRAVGQLSRLVQQAAELGREDLRGAALVALANVETWQGRASEARARSSEAKESALACGDRTLLTRALFQSGYVRAIFEGDSRGGVEELREGIRLAEELRERPLLIEGHMRLGTLLFNAGELADAEEQLERCADLAGELGSFRDQSRATSMLSFVLHYRGQTEDAERLGLQAAEWLERTGDQYFQLQNTRGLAVYALAGGDAKLAERRLQQALPLALEAGGWMVVELYRYLVEALIAQGRIEDAARLAEFARRDLPEDDQYALSAVRVAEALVAAGRGDREGAVSSFREALRLMEELDLVVDLCVARIAFARVLVRLGVASECREELELARAAAAAMDARGLASEVERELSAVAAG
jgi:tetratricopeptide (TPR) repeat protein